MKYADWLDEWLENYVTPACKIRTRELYESIVNRRIKPYLGGYLLEELTPLVMQKFITRTLLCGNKKTGDALSSNSVNGIISVMQNSLKAANSVGLIKEYTANKICRPKTVEKKVGCFTYVEQKAIEKAAFSSRKQKMLGVVICLYTGVRIGELLALKWQHIDFTTGQLNIAQSCYCGRQGRIESTPKTENSKRSIPLPRKILKILREMRAKSDSEYVISLLGKPVSTRSYQKSFELLLNKLHIPHRGFHALRHTFATRALECGMDVKTLSEILGHKNSLVTLNRYAHSLTDHKRAMMNKLGKFLE